MTDVFLNAFSGMLGAVLKIFFIALIAGVMVRKEFIKQEYIKGFSDITIKVLLPSLIFSNVISNFSPQTTPYWWALPLVGLLLPVFAVLVISLFFMPNIKKKSNIFTLAVFQNAGYLVLPIGEILYPNDSDQFTLYVFLYLLGFNPALWSLGKVLVTQNDNSNPFKIRDIITPPLVVNILAVVLVLLKLDCYIPEVVISPISMLGRATVPIALFILGATLATISLRKFPPLADIVKIMLVKYFIIPIVAIVIIINTSIKGNEIMSYFLVIEASAAPAANLILMVRNYGGDTQSVGSIMFIGYILAIIMMPLWVAIYSMF